MSLGFGDLFPFRELFCCSGIFSLPKVAEFLSISFLFGLFLSLEKWREIELLRFGRVELAAFKLCST